MDYIEPYKPTKKVPQAKTFIDIVGAEVKPGPIEIGRNRKWKPAKYDIKEDEGSFLKPRLPRSNTADIAWEAEKLKKAGPRDIGRNKRWKPAKYDVKKDEDSFLAPRLPQTKTEDIAYGAEKKAGPRDIGRNKVMYTNKNAFNVRVELLAPLRLMCPKSIFKVAFPRAKHVCSKCS